jgi:hypothetical protein
MELLLIAAILLSLKGRALLDLLTVRYREVTVNHMGLVSLLNLAAVDQRWMVDHSA